MRLNACERIAFHSRYLDHHVIALHCRRDGAYYQAGACIKYCFHSPFKAAFDLRVCYEHTRNYCTSTSILVSTSSVRLSLRRTHASHSKKWI